MVHTKEPAPNYVKYAYHKKTKKAPLALQKHHWLAVDTHKVGQWDNVGKCVPSIAIAIAILTELNVFTYLLPMQSLRPKGHLCVL